MFRLRPSFVLLAVVLILFGGLASPTTAQEATPPAGEVTILEPDEEYAGATLGEWMARWWQWTFSFSKDTSPSLDATGVLCGSGQSGPVFFLPVNYLGGHITRTCIVPAGMAIYVPVGEANCSTIEPPPFYGRNEKELQACATAVADTITDVTVSINGEPVPDLEPYRVSSPLFPLTFPANHVFFEVPPEVSGVALAVGAGISFIIAPPAPGEYEIVVSAVLGGVQVTTTHRVQVIKPGEEPAAAPPAPSVASPVAAVPCSVEPRSVAEVEAIWASLDGSPVAPQEGPPPFISVTDLPQGEPVDPDTIAVVESVVQQLWACSRTDTLRAFALYTDDLLRVIAPPEAERDMALSGLEVTPAPDELTPAVTVSGAREARLLSAGRVGALVTVTPPDGFPMEIFMCSSSRQMDAG